MDAFFAAVEQKRRSELIGKPVIIGGSGDPAQRGVVSTASYEARKFGIHSAMPLRTAYKLCPQGIFLPVDYEEYSRVSKQVKDILRGFSTVMEDVGIDEAFLDISESSESSEEIAQRIKERIKSELELTCSIGIAENKLLAKMGSDLKKPDGLTIIGRGDIERLIWPLSVRKLWGVGPKTEAHLKSIGINTIGELAEIALERLKEYFGESYGNYLYEASRGLDESPLITYWTPKSSSREITFQRDTNDWQAIARTLAGLTKEVAEDIRHSGYLCKTITLKIRFEDFTTHTRAKTLSEFTDSNELMRKAAFEALGRIKLEKKVRLIGVRASGLKQKQGEA